MSTITQTITALPTAPDPATMTKTVFSSTAAAFVLAQKAEAVELETFRTQANAMASGLNAIATGAALAIPLTFSTTTTDSDPGNGILRLDNATQNTATTIRTDLIGNDGSTWTDVINLFDDSTSTIKGFIVLVDTTDATKWLAFSVSAVASPSGYKNITVACVASSATNPFTNGAALALQFTRTGDKGDTGLTGAAGTNGTNGTNGTGITPQTVGWTGTGGTTPKTLTVDDDLTTAQAARRNAANTFTGQQTFAETMDTVYTITDGAAFEIDPGNGNVQVVTLGANRTPAATNFAAGQTVILGIDDGTAYSVTWTTVAPVWVKAGGTGAAPALAATGYTWILLWRVGSVTYAAEVGKP